MKLFDLVEEPRSGNAGQGEDLSLDIGSWRKKGFGNLRADYEDGLAPTSPRIPQTRTLGR